MAGAGRVRAWGLRHPRSHNLRVRLARTKYIDLHWGGGAGDGGGWGDPHPKARAACRLRPGVLMPRVPPAPPAQAQT